MFIDSRDLRLLAAQGLTIIGIADELGVPVVRVRRAALQYGIDIPFGSRYEKKNPRAHKIARLIELAAEGKTLFEIADALGCCYQYTARLARSCGVKPIRHGLGTAQPTEREATMVTMYRQGVTLEKIGQTFNVTRERVRQILRKVGVSANEGGAAKVAQAKGSAYKAKQDARYLARHGMAFDEFKKWRGTSTLVAYRSQANSARQRGIEWGLNFAQWLDVWLTSGKLELRGRGKGKYCMSRIKDSGGYVVGNVHIQLCTKNSLEAVEKWRGKRKDNRGVFNMYPGTQRPWIARIGDKQIGRYATEAEAVTQRICYAKANGIPLREDGTVDSRKAA
jgi:hypothetical protein